MNKSIFTQSVLYEGSFLHKGHFWSRVKKKSRYKNEKQQIIKHKLIEKKQDINLLTRVRVGGNSVSKKKENKER